MDNYRLATISFNELLHNKRLTIKSVSGKTNVRAKELLEGASPKVRQHLSLENLAAKPFELLLIESDNTISVFDIETTKWIK